jgi:Protein of unknown function (DUF3489)
MRHACQAETHSIFANLRRSFILISFHFGGRHLLSRNDLDILSNTESRSNKKAEVIATMKRAKGVTLAEIVEATGWQKHTVRGFVSILGSKGGEKIDILEERRRGAHLQDFEVAARFHPRRRSTSRRLFSIWIDFLGNRGIVDDTGARERSGVRCLS